MPTVKLKKAPENLNIEVNETSNLEQFIFDTNNRKVSEVHVARIMGSMQRDGFNWNFPLRVRKDGDMYVVLDGQHRLTAARRLGISVYFTVMGDSKDDAVYTANAFSKGWALHDYHRYWLGKGSEVHLYVDNMVKEHGIPLSQSVELVFSSVGSKKKMDAYRMNTLRLDDVDTDKVEDLINKVNTIRLFDMNTKKVMRHHAFVRACVKFVTAKFYDEKRMLKCLEGRSMRLKKYVHMSENIDMLLEMYNYGRAKRYLYKKNRWVLESSASLEDN